MPIIFDQIDSKTGRAEVSIVYPLEFIADVCGCLHPLRNASTWYSLPFEGHRKYF